jgi:hypothetical protein
MTGGMMFKADSSTLEECFTADPGRDAGWSAVERRAGTAVHRPSGAVGDCTIRAVIRTRWAGAL